MDKEDDFTEQCNQIKWMFGKRKLNTWRYKILDQISNPMKLSWRGKQSSTAKKEANIYLTKFKSNSQEMVRVNGNENRYSSAY